MFSIDSRDFLNNPLSFGFITVKQICLFFHVFDFQGPFRRQTDPIILPHHFFGYSRDFLNSPLSFGFITVKQICLFFHVFDFRDLSDAKRTQSFCYIIFLGNRRPWEEELNGEHNEARDRGPRGPTPWTHGGSHLSTRASFQHSLGLHGFVLT
jgi:hypothetical protein